MITNKISYTLGICNGETASACLFSDGVLVAAASEERFSRRIAKRSTNTSTYSYRRA